MKFWDTSALMPLIVPDHYQSWAVRQMSQDRAIAVWWGTEVECSSGLARFERETNRLQPASWERIKSLATAWHVVEPSDVVLRAATRFTRVHPLRAADALQLAAAFCLCDGDPPRLKFLTLDQRLGAVARREGFEVPWPDRTR